VTSVAVVTPSRGLVHSRTIEAVMDNIAEVPNYLEWVLTHDLPIPDCDERVAELGLATGADFLWFIEEDVIPPAGALASSFRLLDQGFDVAAVDYPVGDPKDGWGCLVRDGAGEILWCGLGATLISRKVFEALPRPWFTTDQTFVRSGSDWLPRPNPQAAEHRYGLQDIAFCFALRAAGFRIGQVEGMTAQHAKLEQLGAQGTNHGCHTISIRTEIARQYTG